MVARNIMDTARDKHMIRLGVHQDGAGRKVIDYSDGSEIRTERTGDGTVRPDGRPVMKEVRTVSRVTTPPSRHYGGFGQPKYERRLVAKEKEITNA